MSPRNISIWRRSSNKLRQSEVWLEYLCLIGLSAAAIALFLVNLSSLPLLDSHEATLAQVAKEIYQGGNFERWIFPTLWNEPYLEKPPLVHSLVAIAYGIFGIGEFGTRFPGAFLGMISVLLLYQIGREIFVARLPALFSALVYLTCLPVVRYSRLAALDGPLLCFELFTVWAVLRSRRNLQWAWIVGIGFSLMSLTNGLFGVQILAIVLLFLFWDTPRLLNSSYFWRGLLLGALPGFTWYAAQLNRNWLLKTHGGFWDLVLGRGTDLVFAKLSSSYYLLYSVQYILPWLMTAFAGVRLVRHNLHWGWGRLIAVWLGGYLTLGFFFFGQNYWLVLPLYPALALAAGKQLDHICNLPSSIIYPRTWSYGFAAMAILAAVAGLNWGIRDYIDFYLPFICGSLFVTFSATAIVIAQQDKQFIPLLFWGLLVSIFLLVVSPHWIWELKAVESVKPIAELVKLYTPARSIVYGSTATARPSLEFYSERQIIPQSISKLQQHWQQNPLVYLLLDAAVVKVIDLPQTAIVKDKRLESLGWTLAVKNSVSVLADSHYKSLPPTEDNR